MLDNDIKNLDNDELAELLAIFEGMNDELDRIKCGEKTDENNE